ncbi:MAG: PadR family transcriptional regulator [Actinobacteria bacterium HGW-Actinobacteria-2]|nr:MAG: PadR family transcriptional regulator [Actinobacteria bacterium HGW-Actinobacteria-2]
MPTLSPSAFVVLGLLDRYGPMTPYGLDQRIQGSIGYFWGFPRSQLYSEAARLARFGLVTEVQEAEGRRRRLLSITDAGAAELARWLTQAPTEPAEIRDAGLLRLFFQGSSDQSVEQLAAEQEQAHRGRLAEYVQLVTDAGIPENSPQLLTLTMGMRYEELAIDFWAKIKDGRTQISTSATPACAPTTE